MGMTAQETPISSPDVGDDEYTVIECPDDLSVRSLLELKTILRHPTFFQADPYGDVFLQQCIRIAGHDVQQAAVHANAFAKFRRRRGWGLVIQAAGIEAALRSGVHQLLPRKDKAGRAVITFVPRLADLNICSADEYEKALSYLVQEATRNVSVQEKGVALIVDGSELGAAVSSFLTTRCWDGGAGVCRLGAHPVRLGAIYLINPNFHIRASLLTNRVLGGALALENVVVVGEDRAELYRDVADPKSLPVEFGGKMHMRSQWGHWVCRQLEREASPHRKDIDRFMHARDAFRVAESPGQYRRALRTFGELTGGVTVPVEWVKLAFCGYVKPPAENGAAPSKGGVQNIYPPADEGGGSRRRRPRPFQAESGDLGNMADELVQMYKDLRRDAVDINGFVCRSASASACTSPTPAPRGYRLSPTEAASPPSTASPTGIAFLSPNRIATPTTALLPPAGSGVAFHGCSLGTPGPPPRPPHPPGPGASPGLQPPPDVNAGGAQSLEVLVATLVAEGAVAKLRLTTGQCEAAARDILLRCKRTTSGGDVLTCISTLCKNDALVVLCHQNDRREALRVQVTGPPSVVEVADGEADRMLLSCGAEPAADLGLAIQIRVVASMKYRVCPVNSDTEGAWAVISGTYERTFTLTAAGITAGLHTDGANPLVTIAV